MSRIAGFLCLLTAASAALLLFYVKQQVREMEKELALVHSTILDNQVAIQVQKTERRYLNQPARNEELASRHLGLRPVSAERIIRLEDLPSRASAGSLAKTESTR